MILREHETPKGLLVSVCDAEVLGETFEQGDASLTVEEEFYGGDTADPETVLESLRRAHIANLVGVEVVRLAIEHGFVDEANVLDIGETQHAQMMRLS